MMPSYAELADAILNFARELYAVGPTEYKGTPADLVLLELAERIGNAARTRVAGHTGVLGGNQCPD